MEKQAGREKCKGLDAILGHRPPSISLDNGTTSQTSAQPYDSAAEEEANGKSLSVLCKLMKG